jgi:hypothetical protein
MGQADIVTKEYMREPHVFADAFNFLLYDGRQVIKPSELKELDTAEMMYIFGGGAPKNEAHRHSLNSTPAIHHTFSVLHCS